MQINGKLISLLNLIENKAKFSKEKLKMFIPLCVVLTCIIITASLLYTSLFGTGNLDGLFILSGSSASSFIRFDADGSYRWSDEDFGEKGEWSIKDDKITLTSEKGAQQTVKIVDHKYIAPLGKDFLSGEIPGGTLFDAEVRYDNGEVYTFKSDGKVYTTYEGRNTEFGTYITDGHFIIVTTKTGAITYLNCGDGITSVFYKAS